MLEALRQFEKPAELKAATSGGKSTIDTNTMFAFFVIIFPFEGIALEHDNFLYKQKPLFE